MSKKEKSACKLSIGGQALIEGIMKKPVNRKVEGIIHLVGMILLLGFAVFVDLQRLF